VHAPELERQFVDEGYGVERVPVMYNDFVLLGPPDDPAHVAQAQSAADAMARVARSGPPFISRGDSSGTHLKELEVWAAAGIEPSPDWYREVGQGMSAVITIADDQQAYTLSDRGTYLSHRATVSLSVLFAGDEVLHNPYAMIVVNPNRHPHVRAELAQALVEFVISAEGRALIAGYEVGGQQLFFPH
jgi:tungstate transport system substrate-binding protein